jgi:hypothetical protein
MLYLENGKIVFDILKALFIGITDPVFICCILKAINWPFAGKICLAFYTGFCYKRKRVNFLI